MRGRLETDQGQFFYSYRLDELVPADHLVRKLDAILDLSWLWAELAPYYSHTGRPSIDPELMVRMLIVEYVFAIRSERQICSELQVNMAYRWFAVYRSRAQFPIIRRSRAPGTSAFPKPMFYAVYSRAWLEGASRRCWSAVKPSRSMPA